MACWYPRKRSCSAVYGAIDRRAGDDADSRVAEVDQVLRRDLARQDVVDRHARHAVQRRRR